MLLPPGSARSTAGGRSPPAAKRVPARSTSRAGRTGGSRKHAGTNGGASRVVMPALALAVTRVIVADQTAAAAAGPLVRGAPKFSAQFAFSTPVALSPRSRYRPVKASVVSKNVRARGVGGDPGVEAAGSSPQGRQKQAVRAPRTPAARWCAHRLYWGGGLLWRTVVQSGEEACGRWNMVPARRRQQPAAQAPAAGRRRSR